MRKTKARPDEQSKANGGAPRERLLAIAKLATQLADAAPADLSEHEGRIDQAMNAMVGVGWSVLGWQTPESFARVAICARLNVPADSAQDVRDWIRAVAADCSVRMTPERLRDTTIRAAVEAWSVKQGRPRNGQTKALEAPRKWPATLSLCRECGLGTNVTADALRKEWNRKRGDRQKRDKVQKRTTRKRRLFAR
jgi:hypothetical protein